MHGEHVRVWEHDLPASTEPSSIGPSVHTSCQDLGQQPETSFSGRRLKPPNAKRGAGKRHQRRKASFDLLVAGSYEYKVECPT